ncbi:phytanoyl-CoA dioxygenase family protein [Paenibacillus sp. FJAT-26967]|uniref:phytanoyl-CoA dioxygenase family protein n=1 Tax=Paenibacillus sp. FJAT-26967 TaxID=1729690 RepID=UPI00083934D0|nr:phytanoyl-CoA dioxygenase family protein [Paenibacillus sp. FJAT-26967]
MENQTVFHTLERERVMSPEELGQFQRDGRLMLRQLAKAEDIARIRPALLKEVGKLDEGLRLQVMNVWRKSPVVQAFVFAHQFSQIAADLLGVDGVRLYFDQIFVKKPGAGAMPLHQANQFMLPLDPGKVISMWMPLTDIPDESGPLSYVPQSHLHEKLRGAKNPLLAAMRLGLAEEACGPMMAGDAAFHTGWTLHGAYANNTGTAREMLIITWFADEARAVDPHDTENKNPQLKSLFEGLEPGDPVKGRNFPLLFYRHYRDIMRIVHERGEDQR